MVGNPFVWFRIALVVLNAVGNHLWTAAAVQSLALILFVFLQWSLVMEAAAQSLPESVKHKSLSMSPHLLFPHLNSKSVVCKQAKYLNCLPGFTAGSILKYLVFSSVFFIYFILLFYSWLCGVVCHFTFFSYITSLSSSPQISSWITRWQMSSVRTTFWSGCCSGRSVQLCTSSGTFVKYPSRCWSTWWWSTHLMIATLPK